jgi:hypothetical protein
MQSEHGLAPAWGQKSAEGKMFVRMECDRCSRMFHFSDTPRVTRIPICPSCGNLGSHPCAA